MKRFSADAISGTSEPGKRWTKFCGSSRNRLSAILDTHLHMPVWRVSYLSLLDDAYLPTRAATAQARQWAGKAITIDRAFAEPHSSLGYAHYHEFEWTEAEREFRRSIALNPNYPSAHFYYALYLAQRGATKKQWPQQRRLWCSTR